MNEFFIEDVEKVWGREGWIENTDRRCYKLLLINAGCRGSYHYHKIKDESFKVVRGTVGVELELDGSGYRYLILELGDEVEIPSLCRHRFIGLSEGAILFETSTHHDNDDTYRIEPADSE